MARAYTKNFYLTLYSNLLQRRQFSQFNQILKSNKTYEGSSGS